MAILTKRSLIDKANVTIVVVTSIAVFITIFSLVSSKALFGQQSYQGRVIEAQETALSQLQTNITNAENLNSAYSAFVSSPQNIIGGSASGTSERDGDNARIVLDALPSKYDFPALATSVEKLIRTEGLAIASITGTDDESSQQASASSDSPQPIEMPIKVSVVGDYDKTQSLISIFDRSIRPFVVNQIDFKANQGGGLTTDISATTYYQPARGFEFKTEVVK